MLFDSLEKISKVMRQAPVKKHFIRMHSSGGGQFYAISQGFNQNCVLIHKIGKATPKLERKDNI